MTRDGAPLARRANCARARVLVNVVGRIVEDFGDVVARLDDCAAACTRYELNVSCPNTNAGGLEFGADPRRCRGGGRARARATRRPLFVKLSPTLADIGATARVRRGRRRRRHQRGEHDSRAGRSTSTTRRPALGFGTGGVSGPGLRPVGVLATWKVQQGGAGADHRPRRRRRARSDALQYLIAGASLVAVGTAALRGPARAGAHRAGPRRLVRANDVRGLRIWSARWSGADRLTRRRPQV